MDVAIKIIYAEYLRDGEDRASHLTFEVLRDWPITWDRASKLINNYRTEIEMKRLIERDKGII